MVAPKAFVGNGGAAAAELLFRAGCVGNDGCRLTLGGGRFRVDVVEAVRNNCKPLQSRLQCAVCGCPAVGSPVGVDLRDVLGDDGPGRLGDDCQHVLHGTELEME